MRKICAFILLISILLFAMTGCGSAKSVDLKTVLSDINTQFSDAVDGLKELSDVSELQACYSISPDDVKQFAAEIRTDSSQAPVEIVLVEAASTDAADNVKTALDRRYGSIVNLYASYSPEQLALAKECEVTAVGNYVTMVVAENYSGIMEIVDAAIK